MISRQLVLMMALVPALLFAACKKAPESDVAKTGDAVEVSEANKGVAYPINLKVSKMEWIGTKLSTYHHGEVNIKSGELKLADGKLSGGDFRIDMTTIVAHDAGKEDINQKLTGHLLSPDFFDVANYPEASFEITGVKTFSGNAQEPDGMNEISEYKISSPNYTISGNLKIKDITKNIEFPARVEIANDKISAMAKFNIDRKLWGIVYPGMPDDMVQDMIWFGISIESDITAETALK